MVQKMLRTCEMLLINFEISLDLNRSKNYIIVVTNIVDQAITFSRTDTKLYVTVVTLSIQDNAKLLQQLNSGSKRRINWNEFQSKISTERPNQYLDYLIDSSFQEVNRPFNLSFENEAQRASYKQCYLPSVEIKDYNVILDEQNLFDQLVRNDLIKYDIIRKIATGQEDDCTTCCFLD